MKINYNLKKLMLSTALLFSSMVAFAQLPVTRSTFSLSYAPITAGGGASVSTATGDDGVQTSIPIGFSFSYLGVPQTSLAVSTNGWASFNFTTTSTSFSNVDMYTTAGSQNALFPWFDDLTFGVNSVAAVAPQILYQTTGTPGSQVMTIQWTNVCAYRTAGGSNLNFQIKLYEGTNVIEYHYGTITKGVYLTGQSASIGLENATGGPGNYMDAMTGSSKCGHFYLAESQWPTVGFRFTPGTPAVLAGGTYNVGAGQVYPNLTEAVADIQQRGISGAINLNLTDAVYDTSAAGGNNMFPILLGPITGNSAANTITISKTGTPAAIRWGGNITGSTNGSMINGVSTAINGSNTEPIIGLVGADYVTIDNIDVRGNVGFQNADHAIGIYNNTAADGSQNNLFSNFSAIMKRANTGSKGFIMNVTTTPTVTAGANSNNTIKDFTITNVYAGVQLAGNATFPDLNTQVIRTACASFNTIGDPATTNDIGNGTTATYGINATNQSGFTIANNSIRNVTNTGGQADGINIVTFQGTCNLNNNKIQGIRNSSTSSTTGISGIRMSHTTTGTHTLRVYNNAVSEITSGYTGAASATRTIKGLFIAGTGGATTQSYEIYNNSVSIDGSASPNISSTCYEISTSSGPVYKLGNNIFANHTIAQGATAKHYALMSTSATLIGNTGSTSNNNDFFVANDAGVSGFVGIGSTTNYTTLANWQTAYTQEAASISTNPSFVNNASDLHATALAVNGVGQLPPAYITTDLDCATRTPDNDLGAYILNTCTGAPTAGAVSGSTAVCVGGTILLTLTGASNQAGITYQWASSTTNGGPYTTLLGTSTTQTIAPTVPTYYVVNVVCSASSSTATTSQFSVLVNPNPTITITPSSASYCYPSGAPVALAASGASTYTWAPVAGLSASTGANVNGTPIVNTTYTVSASDVNGCFGSNTVSIVANLTPSLPFTSATPSAICTGETSQLTGVSSVTNSYTVTSVPFAAIATPTTGVTTLCNAGTQVTPLSSGTLDDGGWMNQTIPFTFNYFGANYTSFAISSNGFIVPGVGAPSSYAGYNNIFPSVSAARPAIGPNYSDLDFRTLGTIEYFVTGTAPNRVFVINWTGGNFYNAVGSITTQLQLFEGSNIIEMHTTNSTGNNPTVQGLQNAAGTVAFTAPSRNNVTYTVTVGDAYRFAPSVPTYAWLPSSTLSSTSISNPVASPVATTVYSLTATAANGCALTSTVNVTVNATPTITVNSGAICSGSSFTMTPSGASTYTYSNGSNIDTPTANTSYTVTGTSATGCTNTAVSSVTVNATPTITVNSGTICSGSSFTMAPSGASTYTFSNGSAVDAPTANTSYTVTGASAEGCTNTAVSSVVVNASPTVSVNSGAICSGNSFTMVPSGAISYTYSNGSAVATPTANASYTVTGADANGCFGNAISSVTVNTLPTVIANTSNSLICTGTPVNLSATGATSYTWNTGSNLTTIAVSPTTTTTYTLMGTDANGCMGSATITQSVSTCTGISALTNQGNQISVYPNPNNGTFTLELSADAKVIITDALGRVFMNSDLISGNHNITLNEANGVYFVKVIIGSEQITKRLVINK